MKMEYALSNSFGFGGTNAALLFKRTIATSNCRSTIAVHESREIVRSTLQSAIYNLQC